LEFTRRLRDGRHRLWLTLARRGNEDAFRRLYGELYDPVAGYVAVRVGNRQDAEDLTAAVFQKFLERLDGFDAARGSVMTWIMTMARTAVIDSHRRQAAFDQARGRSLPVEDLADVLAAEQDDPLGAMIRQEDLRAVRRRLQVQPAAVREMFALRFGEGLTVGEVARVMDLSEAAAKQRFARTFRRIRQELLAEETEPKGGPECMIAD
jgi:RNA polymerase sigma-70 factor (ECF subfamily)